VKLLRAHITRYGTAPDGRIFRTSRGGIIQDSAYGAVWAEARQAALTRRSAGRRWAALAITEPELEPEPDSGEDDDNREQAS